MNQLYLNGFAIIVLLITLRTYRRKLRNIYNDELLYVMLAFTVIALLLNGAALNLIWQQSGKLVYYLMYTLQSLDFILSHFISAVWMFYIINRILNNKKTLKKIRYFLPLPLILFDIFMLVTISNGYVFYIDSMNIYHRGPIFFLGIGIGYVYIVAAIVIILLKAKTLNFGELFLYLLFPSVPAILLLVERFVSDPISFVWPSAALVLLEIQLQVLNRKTNIDYLTNLNNRMAFDEYIKRTVDESLALKKSFGLIVMDIDDFKNVNDKYGHSEGDKALKVTADILCDCFTGKNFLSRYGGDEFAVVIKDCSQQELDSYLDELETVRLKYNSQLNKPYNIAFSIGAYVFKGSEISDTHTVFTLVDKIMYEDKMSKKE